MQKWSAIACTLLLALLVAGSVDARGIRKPVDVFISVGPNVPLGNLRGDNFFGFGGETRVGITIGKKVDLLLGIDYHTLESFRTFNLVAGLKANMSHFRSKVKPFILCGFGLAGTITLFERSYISSAGSRSSTRLMIEFGGGVRLGRFVLRSKFVNIFASGNSVNFVPVNVGVMF